MNRILILDGNQRSALAATRSLGKKGILVTVADDTRQTLAGSSIYCADTFTYPSPYSEPERFLDTIKSESLKRNIEIIFPMTEISTYIVLKNRSKLDWLIIPFASYESFENLTDKWRLFELAERLGVPTPKTYFIRSPADIPLLEDEFEYPIVLKPHRSRILENGRWISGTVRYARSKSELKEIVSHSEPFNKHPFLVQEFIRGTGQGVFALYDNGRPVAFFAHKRLREKPPTGGVSVLCESIAVDNSLREIASKILDSVKWHGVAMVEFKVSSDGTPYLMEINARFWGSLQLAIDSGVNFPFLLYQVANGEPLDQINGYKIGIKSRWLLGDLDNLYLSMVRKLPYGSISKTKALIDFLKFFGRDIRYEVNRWDDMKPFLFELKQYVSDLGLQ